MQGKCIKVCLNQGLSTVDPCKDELTIATVAIYHIASNYGRSHINAGCQLVAWV